MSNAERRMTGTGYRILSNVSSTERVKSNGLEIKVMRYPFTHILLNLMLVTGVGYAQNFDADSVYYRPIPKTPQNAVKKITPAKIFRDTVRNDRLFRYFFNVQVGPLIGCNDCSKGKDITFTSSTLHGTTIGKKLRTGIGIGFNSYHLWQTLPVFASASWDLLGTKNTQALFVQLDYGWSAAWKQYEDSDFALANVEGGKMIKAQVGYRIKYHNLKIAWAIGSKFQEVSAYYEYPTFYYNEEGMLVEGTPNTTTVKKDMKRLVLSLSIGWN
jgi:hypothetical protein